MEEVPTLKPIRFYATFANGPVIRFQPHIEDPDLVVVKSGGEESIDVLLTSALVASGMKPEDVSEAAKARIVKRLQGHKHTICFISRETASFLCEWIAGHVALPPSVPETVEDDGDYDEEAGDYDDDN